jgi:predicted TIM-barrel fold metal-dependent hydrolase
MSAVELVPPSTPKTLLPPGACDAHTHVFGPLDQFPLTFTGSYDPPPTPFPVHRAMLDKVGFARALLVQPAPYSIDCRALIDACRRAPDRLRGIAVVRADISDADLAAMRENGIRGLRFVEVPDPQGGGRYRGSVGFDELKLLAPRMSALGLHAQIWADAERIAADADELLSFGVPIVADHLGKPKTANGVNDPAFQKLLRLVADSRIWVKLTVCRASTQFPDYGDVRPLHDALIAASPEQLLWGSDWPHVRMGALTPDVGHLVDLFDRWTGNDAALRRKIFVDNPARLYGF